MKKNRLILKLAGLVAICAAFFFLGGAMVAGDINKREAALIEREIAHQSEVKAFIEKMEGTQRLADKVTQGTMDSIRRGNDARLEQERILTEARVIQELLERVRGSLDASIIEAE